MRFSPYDMHVERLAATTWTQTKEVGVVRNLVLAFLAADVNGNRNTLSVGIVDFQWGLLAMLYVLLIHETGSSVTQCEESVVVGIHAVAVAGEGVDEQLQLVVGTLADMDAQTTEGVFQMVGAFLYVGINRNTHDKVEMGIDQLLVLPGNDFLHFLDVLHSNEVAGVGHTGMTILLLVEKGELSLLVRYEEHLVIHHDIG